MSWQGAVLLLRAAVVASVLLALVAPARAAELDWQAPAPCPDTDELRFRVERAIGMPLSHAAELSFVVRARATERGYEASIDVLDATARRRTLSAAACPELVDMVTVTVALALGADVSLEPSETKHAASAPQLVSPAPAEPALVTLPTSLEATPSDATSPDEAQAPAHARWLPGLALWLLADSGSLPKAGGGL